MSNKKWIQNAIRPSHRGDFMAKAKRAHETVAQYAKEHMHDKSLLGRQARFAITLRKMHR